MQQKAKAIIWDWNGTLLDDQLLCVNAINFLLVKRQLSPITETQYKSIFTFPVKDYYLKAGFQFENESFEEVAVEFIDYYKRSLAEVGLFEEARTVLQNFQLNGYRQFVVSAMKHDLLKSTIEQHNLSRFFEEVSGIHDHLAHGKEKMAEQFIYSLDIEPSDLIWIGDTIHDFEIAKNLGVSCILVSQGHQSKERLETVTNNVVENLLEAEILILENRYKNENS